MDDDRKFSRFVAERTPALLRLAYLVTGDRDKAQDLLQESLIRLHGRWGRIRDPAARDAYLRRIIVTRAINDRKRRWNGEYAAPDLISIGGTDDPWPAADLRHGLVAALRGLSTDHRAVLVLRYYEDLTEAQTADVLGCSLGTVKSRSARAL